MKLTTQAMSALKMQGDLWKNLIMRLAIDAVEKAGRDTIEEDDITKAAEEALELMQ